MPVAPKNLLEHLNLPLHGGVRWGEPIPSNFCGIYLVTLTNNPERNICLSQPTFNKRAIGDWIELIRSGNQTLTVDNRPATIETIIERLSEFWIPDETILYIGKAGPAKMRTLKKRVNEYYETKLGCSRKHSGGHWLNTLSQLDSLSVYYSEYKLNDIDKIESQLIEHFSSQLSEESLSSIFDRTTAFPFANKELRTDNKRIRKQHGIQNPTIDCGMEWRKKAYNRR